MEESLGKAMQYDDFDLAIFREGERYRVRLLRSIAGEGSGNFEFPFSRNDLSNFYSRIGQATRNVRHGGTKSQDAAQEFGSKLFQSVFTGEILAQLRTSLDRSRESGRGVRLRLRLNEVPEISELPWEFLYDDDQHLFFAMSASTPVVRYLDLPHTPSLLSVDLPLRVLVVIASPSNLARLDSDGEWGRLTEALGGLQQSGRVVLERLPSATLEALWERSLGEPFHVIHFIGHGGYDNVLHEGSLHLEDAQGMSKPVSGDLLGTILRDHRSLRLAVLNACEGARQSDEDPFSGVAQSLCRQRLPAVVAMQFEISDDAAKIFAQAFYTSVAKGNPVDASLSQARQRLLLQTIGQDWATPVLFMRSQSGDLFDLQTPVVAPATSEPAPMQSKGPTVESSPVALETQARMIHSAVALQPHPSVKDSASLNALGLRYRDGEGVDQDYARAMDHFRQAADLGDADGQKNVGVLYDNGWGVEVDRVEARAWYEKAVSQGNLAAMDNLGTLYYLGEGVKQDFLQAKTLWERAAGGGYAHAKNNLGVLVYNGHGRTKFGWSAEELFVDAASVGDDDALANLSKLYAAGGGERFNAAKWNFFLGDAENNPVTMHFIGHLYENGWCVPKNRSTAQRYYQRATDAGYVPQKKHLAMFHKQEGTPKVTTFSVRAGRNKQRGS